MKILVMGGDGFIGSHLVDRLVEFNHDVTVFDRFPYARSRNLEHQKNNISLLNGELGNRDQLYKALEGQELVYHFISCTNPSTSWNDPFVEIEMNLKESLQLFDIAVRMGVKKIVFPSSGGTVYGICNGVVDEQHLTMPFSPYGIAKLSIEHFLNYYVRYSGISVDVYRIGNPYGPRQPSNISQGVVAVWMHKIFTNEEIIVYGGDYSKRDYVYVGDVAHLMMHSVNNVERACYNIYNLGTGIGTSIMGLLEIFKNNICIPFKYKVLPQRHFDNTSVILNSNKILYNFPCFKFQKIEDKIREMWLNMKNSNI